MKASTIIKEKPYLMWSTTQYDTLSDEAVVEAVLQFGDMDDVKKLIAILSMKTVAEIFSKQIKRPRNNYSPAINHYFQLYFQKHA
ncbi:MAG: hypothetical protein WC864_09045 [Ilumatobacteraceae bacterium]